LALELLFWIGAAPLDSVIAGPVNGPGLTAMRLGLGVPPMFLALLLHARLPREAFLRWGTLVVLLGTQSLTLTVVLFVALSPVAASLPMAQVSQTILRE
jgi:hypothetical protein